jgi:hypothetical protein
MVRHLVRIHHRHQLDQPEPAMRSDCSALGRDGAFECGRMGAGSMTPNGAWHCLCDSPYPAISSREVSRETECMVVSISVGQLSGLSTNSSRMFHVERAAKIASSRVAEARGTRRQMRDRCLRAIELGGRMISRRGAENAEERKNWDSSPAGAGASPYRGHEALPLSTLRDPRASARAFQSHIHPFLSICSPPNHR